MLKSNKNKILCEFCKLCFELVVYLIVLSLYIVTRRMQLYIIIIIIILECIMYKKGYSSQLLHTALYNTCNTNPSYSRDKVYKSNTSQGWWAMATDDANHFFHILSIVLTTALSLQTLSITITTFSLICSGNSRQQTLCPLMEKKKVPFTYMV